MQFLPVASGGRTLRLLTLTSALALAGCGGGGSGPTAEAPAGEPAPTSNMAAAVQITSANQQGVASDAGTVVTTLTPSTAMFSFFALIPPTAVAVQAQATALPVANTTALLSAAARKFAPTGASALAVGVTTTEQVACTSGSGTITNVEPEVPEGATSYTASLTVVLDNCVTTLMSDTVTMNGTLKLSVTVSESSTSSSGAYDLLATGYTIKGEGIEAVMDGDMRIAFDNATGSDTVTVSGKRLKTTSSAPAAPLSVSAETTPATYTVTLHDYSQVVQTVGEALHAVTTATVETTSLGTLVSYQLTTPKVLVNSSSMYTSGQVKVVGANRTALLITANGDGTFKLERDEGGDGSIEQTVNPVEAWQLGLGSLSTSPSY